MALKFSKFVFNVSRTISAAVGLLNTGIQLLVVVVTNITARPFSFSFFLTAIYYLLPADVGICRALV